MLLCFSLRRCEQKEKNTFIMSEMAHIISDPEQQTKQLISKTPIEYCSVLSPAEEIEIYGKSLRFRAFKCSTSEFLHDFSQNIDKGLKNLGNFMSPRENGDLFLNDHEHIFGMSEKVVLSVGGFLIQTAD